MSLQASGNRELFCEPQIESACQRLGFFVPASCQLVKPFEMNALSAFLLTMRSIHIYLYLFQHCSIAGISNLRF